MKIGIIGSGSVAKALGEGLSAIGHKIMLGTRDASKLSQWSHDNKIQVGNFAETARFGEAVILAVKGSAAVEAIKLAGPENLEFKTVLDTCNPIADAPPVDGVLQFFTGPNESLLERLQQEAPSAYFVKAFSCIGSSLMVQPKFKGGTPTMFICGNNENAKKETGLLCEALGFDVADMGSAAAARAIEPLCMLWCIPGFVSNDWRHAFQLLR